MLLNPLTDPPQKCSLRLAIIGDPHFVHADHQLAQRSHLKFDSQRQLHPNQPSQHPWGSLLELVKTDEDAKRIDLVLCVGDLSSGGDKIALETGWTYLNQLSQLLGAKLLACATGNHDVLSRSQAKKVYDNVIRQLGESRGPHENLRELEPPFPIVPASGINAPDPNLLRTQYFGDHVTCVTTTEYRLVVLDSCCEHTADFIDNEKGSFPPSAMKALTRALGSSGNPPISILVCHHPPMPHGYFGENNYDFISGGSDLLRVLEQHGPWLIVHGHKHHGYLTYGQGGGGSPIVFAAGSMGAWIEKPGDGFRNQFYVVELETTQSGLRGHVRSWDWNLGFGYQRSTRKLGGIFDGCGFGHRRSPHELAQTVANASAGKLPMHWSEVLTAVPELAHVLPSDLLLMERILETTHSMIIEPDTQGNLGTLAKAAK